MNAAPASLLSVNMLFFLASISIHVGLSIHGFTEKDFCFVHTFNAPLQHAVTETIISIKAHFHTLLCFCKFFTVIVIESDILDEFSISL